MLNGTGFRSFSVIISPRLFAHQTKNITFCIATFCQLKRKGVYFSNDN